MPQAKVRDDILTLDMALGCRILNMSEDELRELADLPDLLDALGLNNARSALRYYLGYSDELCADGSIPQTDSDEEVSRLFSTLRSQPVARAGKRFLVANEPNPQTLATSILGMTVEISFSSRPTVITASALPMQCGSIIGRTMSRRAIPSSRCGRR